MMFMVFMMFMMFVMFVMLFGFTLFFGFYLGFIVFIVILSSPVATSRLRHRCTVDGRARLTAVA